MAPASSLKSRQFSLTEALAFLTLVALGLGALKCKLHPVSIMIAGSLLGWALAIALAHRQKRIVYAVIGAILLPLVSFPLWVNAWIKSIRSGPAHVFVLEGPKFLAEDVALDRAQVTLALDGLVLASWKPVEDGRSTSPDGVVDKYLTRNTLNPNDCNILFVNNDQSARDPGARRKPADNLCLVAQVELATAPGYERGTFAIPLRIMRPTRFRNSPFRVQTVEFQLGRRHDISAMLLEVATG